MSFEDVMMQRLSKCHTEACDEILASVKAGRSLSDAVTDAIEALPASKTRDLRRWLEDWEAWEEWLKWQKRGWRARRSGEFVDVYAPPKLDLADIFDGEPPTEAIAAAVGVRKVAPRKTAWTIAPYARDRNNSYTAYFQIEDR